MGRPWPLIWSEGISAFVSFPRETTGDPRISRSSLSLLKL